MRHEPSNIPHTNSFVPAAARSPAFTPKQTPIDACRELGMDPHPSSFSWNLASLDTVTPDSTGHIITRTEQEIW